MINKLQVRPTRYNIVMTVIFHIKIFCIAIFVSLIVLRCYGYFTPTSAF